LKIKNRSLWNSNLNLGVKNPYAPYFISNKAKGQKALKTPRIGYAMAKQGEFLSPIKIRQRRSILVGVEIDGWIPEIVAAQSVNDVVHVAEGGAK
jgi:hypothetical protein